MSELHSLMQKHLTCGGVMFTIARSKTVPMAGLNLASCGALSDGCSDVEMTTQPGMFDQTEISVRNTADEPKLVTLAIIDSDGSEINSETMRVASKDIVETAAGSRTRSPLRPNPHLLGEAHSLNLM
ncbi:hypothetical protein [Tsuneonella flava]|uniref:hypothetical protein n=1 Tax=Tsuneonella flava TaxID=2055955 RepID=UPI000F4B262C|nr:hypothetical protein [Tsuneonella flava]